VGIPQRGEPGSSTTDGTALESVQAKWQSDLNGEAKAAQIRWQTAVENAFASAQERAAESLNDRANGLLLAIQQGAERLNGTFRASAAEVAEASIARRKHCANRCKRKRSARKQPAARAIETSERLEQTCSSLETVQEHALTRYSIAGGRCVKPAP